MKCEKIKKCISVIWFPDFTEGVCMWAFEGFYFESPKKGYIRIIIKYYYSLFLISKIYYIF